MLLRKLKIGAATLLAFVAVGLGGWGLKAAPPQAEQPESKPFGTAGIGLAPISANRPKPTGEQPKPITVSGRVAYLVWSPDGTLVTSSGKEPKEGARLGNYTVQFWDAKTGQEKLSLGEEAETQLERPTFSPDGKQLALLSYKKEDKRNVFDVLIYDTAKGTLVREIKGCHYLGGWPAFSPDGKTLATPGSKLEPFKGEFERFVAEVKLWDAATGEMKRLLEDKRELDFRSQFVGGLAFSPDGKTLATPGIRLEYTRDMVPDRPDLKNPIIQMPRVHHEVVLWDLDAGKVKRVLKGESSWFSVAYTPDGKFLVAADYGGEVRVWDVETGKLERTLTHERGVYCKAVLSADGKWLATEGGKFNKEKRQNECSVKLWDFRTGEVKQTLPESELVDAGPVVFSPDGKRLALGIGSTVRFWDIEKAAFEK